MNGKVGERNRLGESSYFMVSNRRKKKKRVDDAHDTSMVMVQNINYKQHMISTVCLSCNK